MSQDDSNFWSTLMGSDDEAAVYQISYGEGPGCETRKILGSFVNDGESVLDAGCGPGHNYEHFRDYGPSVPKYKGTDYSPRFVRACKNKYPDVEFEVQDIRDFKEADASYDAVILQDCLEHTNGYEKPMGEALRVAKKRVVVSFWHLTENDSHINDDGNDGYGAWYARPEWESFLDKLGFSWEHAETPEGSNRHHDFYVIHKKGDV